MNEAIKREVSYAVDGSEKPVYFLAVVITKQGEKEIPTIICMGEPESKDKILWSDVRKKLSEIGHLIVKGEQNESM